MSSLPVYVLPDNTITMDFLVAARRWEEHHRSLDAMHLTVSPIPETTVVCVGTSITCPSSRT